MKLKESKGIKNKKHLLPFKVILMLLLYFVSSNTIKAQLVPDVATIEAYIRDTKSNALFFMHAVFWKKAINYFTKPVLQQIGTTKT